MQVENRITSSLESSLDVGVESSSERRVELSAERGLQILPAEGDTESVGSEAARERYQKEGNSEGETEGG